MPASLLVVRPCLGVGRRTTATSRSPSIARVHAASPQQFRHRRWGVRAQAQPEEKPPSFQTLGRLVQTLGFFNNLPSPGKVISDLLATAVGESPKPAATQEAGEMPQPLPRGRDGVVLVTGATGGVGKRVVCALLDAAPPSTTPCVRALVRNEAKAGDLLDINDPRLQVVTGDITQAATLQPAFFDDVTAVLSCTAVTVGPKEGDTEDRQKYYQGIKFYDPSIVGDTPETVELLGLSNVLRLAQRPTSLAGQVPLLLAGGGSALSPFAAEWGALDDIVMGGVSESQLTVRKGAGEGGRDAVVFGGVVREENNGGFVSARSRNFSQALDVSAYDGIQLRVLGNGLRYKLYLRTEEAWDGIAYGASFDTTDGEWQTVKLPFSSFQPIRRAKTTPESPPLNASKLLSMQIMLSKFEYDEELNPAFKAGAFELPIDFMATYNAQERPKYVHVSSGGVTRWNRPGIDVSQEPPAVGMNEALGGILTYKLEGEDAIRASGIPFTIVRPCALTEEPRGAELVVDQGDTIKGKVSREDVAELLVHLLDEPCACNTIFEIKSTVPFSQPWTIDEANPPPPRDWHTLLADADLQVGVSGKTIDGVYTGKNVESEVRV